MEERVVKKTYLEAPGFYFEVANANVTGDIEAFKVLYIAQRKLRYKGVWTEAGDIGYQNFLKVLEEGIYKMGYHEDKIINRIPARLKCCGTWLELGNFTNTCASCGADYNSNGSLLAPRHMWGEETGEHWTDCV
jgi:hypothetical protein